MTARALCYPVVDPHNPVEVVVTDEHPASSFGLPVVLLDGEPVGPGELLGTLMLEKDAAPELVAGLESAGYRVRRSS